MLYTLEQDLDPLLTKISTDCCVPTDAITLPEADAVLSTAKVLVPKVADTLSAVVSKKSHFEAVFLALNIVKTHIKTLNAQIETLNTCLIAKTPTDPPSYLITANGYVTEINNAFSAARSAFGI